MLFKGKGEMKRELYVQTMCKGISTSNIEL